MTEQAADTRDFEAGDVPELNRWALAVRRTLDLVIGLVVLVLLIVPSLIIIVLVVVTSRGPILFTQKRVGKNGRTFNVLKFRTMQAGTHTAIITDDAELARYQDNGFKVQPDDPRITSVGRVLRKLSLDEIPQLVNVFWGDMSIVGIRPLLPEELALRSERDQMLYRMLRPVHLFDV
jgi:exopolysaccharide production protein ExoY